MHLNIIGGMMEKKVIALVSKATACGPEKISVETSLIDDLDLDSLDIVELMLKIEDEFGIEIPAENAEEMKTVQDVVNYLKAKQS